MSDGDYQILNPSEFNKAEYVIKKIRLLVSKISNDAELGEKIRELINNIETLKTIDCETKT